MPAALPPNAVASPADVRSWSDTPERRATRSRAFKECFGPSVDAQALAPWRGHALWRSYATQKSGACALAAAAGAPCAPDVVLPFLLAEGLDVNARDEQGRTPLHAATWGSRRLRQAWVRLLLEHGARADVQDDQEMTAMGRAMRTCDARVLEVLIEHGATPCEADRKAALKANNAESMALFWRHFGVPPSQEERTHAFLRAAEKGRWQAARALLEQGVDIHAQHDGCNAVMLACQRARPPAAFIQVLVARGVDPTQADAQGRDALALAGSLSSWHTARRAANLVRVGQAIASGREEWLGMQLPSRPPVVERGRTRL